MKCIIIILGATGIFCLSGCTTIQREGAAGTGMSQAEVAQWEYRVVYAHRNGEADLNQLGQEGWELVSITTRPTSGGGDPQPILYLKRPR